MTRTDTTESTDMTKAQIMDQLSKLVDEYLYVMEGEEQLTTAGFIASVTEMLADEQMLTTEGCDSRQSYLDFMFTDPEQHEATLIAFPA